MNNPCINLTEKCFINGTAVDRQTTVDTLAQTIGCEYRTSQPSEASLAFAHFDGLGMSVVFDSASRTMKTIRLKFCDEPIIYLAHKRFSGDLIMDHRHFNSEGWKIIENFEVFDFLPQGLVLFPSAHCALWLQINDNQTIYAASIEWGVDEIRKRCCETR